MIRYHRTNARGFTLVEVLIVTTITAALMLSALLLFRGKIPQTQFTGAVNNLHVQLRDYGNQVISGHYPTTESLTCTSTGDLIPGGGAQGTNKNCIFLGQAIQFESEAVKFYTVYGKRLKDGVNVATTLSEAQPKIEKTVQANSYTLGYGLQITKVVELPSSLEIGGLAFVQTFGSRLNESSQPAGSPQVNIVPLRGTALGQAENAFKDAAKDTSSPLIGLYSPPNPEQGIMICLQGGVKGQYAVLTVGSNGANTSSDPKILNQTDWSNLGCA